jgi:DNA-binding NtrC family response regulator
VEPLPHGSEWVLVVDDEDGVRDFIERALSRLGYHVTAVSSGEDALERVRGYFSEPIDLLITDVVMPRMGGVELAGQLIARNPKLPVLYVFGYAAIRIVQGTPIDPSGNLLQKPFTSNELLDRVARLLAG